MTLNLAQINVIVFLPLRHNLFETTFKNKLAAFGE